MKISNEQRLGLKGKGYITMRDPDYFSCRVVLPAGNITAAQAQKLSQVCQSYGKGYFTTTQRGNIQIPWLAYEHLETVTNELADVGLTVGGTGMRVRPAQACKGLTCGFSQYDAENVTMQINERFYEGQYNIKLPNKFRIQISACPNNCAKTQLACIGLIGKKRDLVVVSIGGLSGRDLMIGREITGLYTIPQALDIIERALRFYEQNGKQGERFAMLVNRLGFETVEQALVQ